MRNFLKIHYYCYYVEDIETRNKYLFDIRPFLKAFTTWENSLSIATNLTNGKEHLYLLPEGKNYFLFVQTKSNDVIQMIETKGNSIDTSKIVERLDKDTTLGFASYVLFHETENLFAFSSRLSSPRVNAFKNFFNDMFLLLNEGRFSFVVTQMKNSIEKSKAANLQFIGRTQFTVNKDNSLFQHIIEKFVGNTIDKDMIETLEITLKPATKQNIRQSAGSFITRVEENGLEGVVLKGKSEIDKPLRNFYITSSGGIFDEVDSLDNNLINQSMSDRLKDNTILKEKVEKFKDEEEFTEERLERLEVFYDPKKWPTIGKKK